MKTFLLSLLIALMISPIAYGAKSTGTASISLDQTNVSLGDNITFTTTVPSLAGWEYPMIAVGCWQDVNGDSVVDTNWNSPDIVYSSLNPPGSTFTLGGYSSIWTQRGGGPAVCRADLDAYGWKGGKESVRVLASVSFDSNG